MMMYSGGQFTRRKHIFAFLCLLTIFLSACDIFGGNNNHQVHPQLAQSWDESSNGLTWTFHLKTNLKFSDGKPLTSRDVAYSIDRALQPATKSNVAPIYLGLVKDSEKLLTSRISTLIG